MLYYQILFIEGDIYYVILLNDTEQLQMKMTKTEFEEFKIDKTEI